MLCGTIRAWRLLRYSDKEIGELDMEFKDKVKYVRKKFYLSQEMMAKELGVAFATVNRWESGRCQPNYRAQKAFSDFCKQNGVDVDSLEQH